VVFRVLGPLEVAQGGSPVLVPPGKQRVVLAALLLHANRTVSIPELADKLWDGLPPADSRGTVQKYVMRLRRALAGTDTAIHTEPDGYRIELFPGQLDLDRSDALVEQGVRAAKTGDPHAAAARLGEALQLWRAVPPLMNVASAALHRNEVPRLVEQYLQALELRIDVDLQLGRHAELCGELIGLVRTHPLRERFWAQRMRALYAAGRQGEALEAYREVSRLLADELGIDPGPELRAAHEEILRRAEPTTPAAAVHDLQQVVHQLPMAATGIVGRRREIAQITDVLGVRGEGAAPHLVVVTGPPGVGKTAVAVHAAHRLVDRFPDGQLFADLRGYGDAQAQSAEETLGHFLRALGVPPAVLPHRRDDAVAAYRTLTAGRRLLIVLDGVTSPAQVRTLLPGGATCGVLVTSRRELAGLLVSPGGRRVPLAVLPPGEADDVLRSVVGDGRVAAERDAADALLALCDGLPLALRVAAVHLVTRPHLAISDYLDELRAGDPVSALRVEGDGQVGVADALDASYLQLGLEQRRLLRLLSLVMGDRITVPAAAALTEGSRTAAALGLEQLAETGLLDRRDCGYRLHTLTRAFAAQRLALEEPADEQQRARQRLFGADALLAPSSPLCAGEVR
jgi:DNA-binding SARP family transcriptional activator